VTYGEVQVVHGDPSIAHWKVAPAWSEWNVKVALNSPVGSGGPESTNVFGSPVVIQTNGRTPGAGVGSTFPAASIARTHSHFGPDARPSRNQTVSHSCQVVGAGGGVPAPNAHSNVSTGSFAPKANVTSGPELAGFGLRTIEVSGGVVSAGAMISHS
jgi:hypothetical protein